MRKRTCATGRAGLALALLTTTFLAVPAEGGRPCPLLRDPPGDGGGINAYLADWLPNDRSLDLLTVDMASRGALLDVTVQVSQLDRMRDQWYEVFFDVGSDTFYLAAYLPRQPGIGNDRFSVGYFSEQDGDAGGYAHLADVPGRADMARSRLSWVLDTRRLHPRQPVRRGTVLAAVRAEAERAVGMGGATATLTGDQTTETADFVHGTPACATQAARG